MVARKRYISKSLPRELRADRRGLIRSLHRRRGLRPHEFARRFPEQVGANPFWRAAMRALRQHPGVAAFFSRRGQAGAAWRDLNVLYCPAPVTAWGCAVFFHELHHLLTPRGLMPRYLEELEADLYGFSVTTRALGMKRMPKWLRTRMTEHLDHSLRRAIRRGLRTVDPRARRYLKVEDVERLERMIARTPRRRVRRRRSR